MNPVSDPQSTLESFQVFRTKPLTVALAILLGVVYGFGLIWIFAFADSTAERWNHAAWVAALASVLAVLLGWAKRREDRGLLPLAARRAVWLSVLIGYGAAIVVVIQLGLSPFTRFLDSVRVLCYLGAVAPAVWFAWHCLRTEKPADEPVRLPAFGVFSPERALRERRLREIRFLVGTLVGGVLLAILLWMVV
ncbi:MAG: hypothetical protein JNN01_23470 [Opitutaceae bacterium]|nr:hypothetical protein [Opitutaceae bacterium]